VRKREREREIEQASERERERERRRERGRERVCVCVSRDPPDPLEHLPVCAAVRCSVHVARCVEVCVAKCLVTCQTLDSTVCCVCMRMCVVYVHMRE